MTIKVSTKDTAKSSHQDFSRQAPCPVHRVVRLYVCVSMCGCVCFLVVVVGSRFEILISVAKIMQARETSTQIRVLLHIKDAAAHSVCFWLSVYEFESVCFSVQFLVRLFVRHQKTNENVCFDLFYLLIHVLNTLLYNSFTATLGLFFFAIFILFFSV